MPKSDKQTVDRRNFLKGAAAGGIATLVASTRAVAAPVPAGPAPAKIPVMPKEADPPDTVEVLTTDRPGSDFMVDVIKSLGFEYLASNPGSSFRGLHESLINYGGNKAPEFLTCCHEESSVAMAHGYADVEGKPHAGAGPQHRGTAARCGGIYNAWGGRAPVIHHPWEQPRCGRNGVPGSSGIHSASGRGGDGSRLYQVGRPAELPRHITRSPPSALTKSP